MVEIHFLDRRQIGRLVIANGTSSATRLLSLEYDRKRFKVLGKPDQADAQQSARVLLHYQGNETQKELRSQISLVLESLGQKKRVTVPVLYNHLSPGGDELCWR